MPPIIEVHNISKQYRLGTVGTGSLHHDINRWWHRLRGKEDPYLKIGETNDRAKKGESEYVWALRDISFTVQAGEVLGIIGRNGAGKSTLLKILSRITTPTTGSIKLRGRVASLLEVGTGMHPELTGRENIYLNGAILGMRKKEIDRKLDEIVDFSGVERYLDTPVKRYSSGMHVRLGFAVAAHLEPEILIVDEVLAVGDAEFQKKCLGKMKDVSANEGRTVLFVSHNISAVQRLCEKCMLLKDGNLIFAPDETQKVVEKYQLETNRLMHSIPLEERKDRIGSGEIRIIDLHFKDKLGNQCDSLISGQTVSLVVEYVMLKNDLQKGEIEIAVSISRANGLLITVLSSIWLGYELKFADGFSNVSFLLRKLPLTTGGYTMNICIKRGDFIIDWIQEAKYFEVINGDYYKTGAVMPESHLGIYFDYEVI
jgi:lipopolysaccharide transport system ATP-binding protein